jgi:DNA gyrase subunit A
VSDSGNGNGNGATPSPDAGGTVETIEIQEEMEQSFIDYAMSVIVARALPDVRDGLKPVHRRILWAMHDANVTPERSHTKCATVVGDVIGHYHPHGDQAVYDALVRMGQHFSLRHQLIDPHGNFGSPSDPPAAYRYCVTGDSTVRMADGTTRPMSTVAAVDPDAEVDIDLKVLDRNGDPVHATKLFHSGDHPVLRLRTKEGFELTGTENHPVLCIEAVAGVPMLQWKLLDEIAPGDRVAIFRADADEADMPPGDIPFVGAYVRSEVGVDSWEWLKKRNIDRVERWELDGDEIWSKISNPEVRRVVEPIVDAGYFYATVDAVESAGTQPVYSLRVDSDDHSFLTNGFVSHNTECRLSRIATHLLANIDEETVDFQPNFDGKHDEPIVLPARFPNLLVNGSQGIAVGMATNIPPHNLGEVIDATTHLIDNPDANVEDLMQFVKAPDFPTGGLILGQQGSIDAFKTGRGSIKLRAVAEIEETKRGTRIVVTEIPYQTSVEAIEQKIADLVDRKEIQGLREIRNESAHGNTKLVIELKKDAPALVILNNLYKHTPLQTNFAVNMVALDDGVPRTLNLRDALQAYIDHQVDVITRRTQFRLDKAKARAHIVEGLVKALGMIDKIIAAIRKAKDRAAALASLTNKTFGFTEIQANHILDMQLHRLTQLGRQNLEAELKELRKTIRELAAILKDQGKLRGVIKTEMAEIREKYAEPRKTPVTFDSGEINIEDLIDDEDLVVTLTSKGYVKTVSADAFRTQGRGGRGVAGAKLRDEDYVTAFLSTTAHAYLLFFSNQGKVYRLKAHEIPMKERTARGTAIPNLLQLAPDERIQAIIDTRDYETNRFLFFVTRKGQVKKTKFTEYDSARSGLRAINLKDGDELVKVLPTNGEDDIFVVSKRGQAIRFSEADVRPMGRGTAGVRGMRLRAGDEVVSCDIVYDDCALLTVTDGGYGKRTQLDRFNTQGRGGMGVRAMKIVDKKGEVVASFMVHVDEEIFVIATGGVVIRMPVKEISSQGRDATGVKVMNLEKEQRVAAVAPVLQADDDESVDA